MYLGIFSLAGLWTYSGDGRGGPGAVAARSAGQGAARSSPSAPAQHSRFGASRVPEARAGLWALSVTKDIAKNDLDFFFFF